MKRPVFDASGDEWTVFHPFSEVVSPILDKLEAITEVVDIRIGGFLNGVVGGLDFKFDLFGVPVVVGVSLFSWLAYRYDLLDKLRPRWKRAVAFPPADNMELPDTAAGFGVPPSSGPKFPSESPKGSEPSGWDSGWRDFLARIIQRRLDN